MSVAIMGSIEILMNRIVPSHAHKDQRIIQTKIGYISRSEKVKASFTVLHAVVAVQLVCFLDLQWRSE